MSKFNFNEKRFLEKFLEMESGVVLNFTNRTFREFIIDAVNLDIYDEKYSFKGESKANRLRTFWEIESNYNNSLLLKSLLEYWISQIHTGEREHDHYDENLYKECEKIVERLKQEVNIENIDAIKPNIEDKDFSLLAESIKESIHKNQPEASLDRLHTFIVRYVRELCKKHSILFKQETPLHSLFGMYIKYLNNEKLIESIMTERILKSSISVLEAFSDVRNNQSFAHDNEILNYQESILIFNDVANVIRFIEELENKYDNKLIDNAQDDEEWDLPF